MIKLSLKKKSSIRQEFLNSKLGVRESMGGDFFQRGGGGWASLNIIVMWGGLKLIFVMRRGVWLSFGTYFTHFPIPPPGNYCTVPKSRYGRANRAGSIFKQSLSYRWQAHIQKLHNRVKCSREYSTSAAFETKLGPKLRFSALKHIWTTVSVTR